MRRLPAAMMMAGTLLVCGLAASAEAQVGEVDLTREQDRMSSLGIAGFDPETGEVGVAFASRVLAAGQFVAWVRAGVAAVVAMGGAPYGDGELMLDWMEAGATPEEVFERLRERHGNIGQIGIADVHGRSISNTNPNTSEWRGNRYGLYYGAGGNILVGPAVVDGFADTFEETEGSGLPLAERLMMALEAADAAGGDARGRMGTVLKVHRAGGGYGGSDVYIDLRVDDSPNAIDDLRRLYERWKVERQRDYGTRMIGQSEGRDVERLQRWLSELGYVEPSNSEVFDGEGEPLGVFNDATAEAVSAFRQDHQLGPGGEADRATLLRMIEVLGERFRTEQKD